MLTDTVITEMAFTTPKMGLRVWDNLNDPYDHDQLANNWAKVDFHDHTPGRGVQIPGEGLFDGSITSSKIAAGGILAVNIADNAITNAKMADNSVGNAEMMDNSIGAAEIIADSVGESELAPASVGTAELIDNNVTLAKLNTTVVTSLPGSPIDGQQCYYQADATNGIIWHLRYRSASSSAYKWEFVGGPSLYDHVDALEGSSSGTYGNLATTGPQITVPLAGDYLVQIGAHISVGAGPMYGYMSFSIGGSAANDGNSLSFGWGSGGAATDARGNAVNSELLLGLVAGTALIAKYRYQAASTPDFDSRFMSVIPRRVG